MIELSPLMTILLIEALVVLVLLTIIFLLVFRKKNIDRQVAVQGLIAKLKKNEKKKALERSEIITEQSDIDPEIVSEFISEISVKERELYKQIIQIFLNKDANKLKRIDQYFDGLAESYLSTVSYLSQNNEVESEVSPAELLQATVATTDNEEQDNLKEKLAVAINTMEEISAEYTRVFSGTQTELELENSSKKMFQIFRDANSQVKASTRKIDIEEL